MYIPRYFNVKVSKLHPNSEVSQTVPDAQAHSCSTIPTDTRLAVTVQFVRLVAVAFASGCIAVLAALVVVTSIAS